jgi:hypothetical protein
LAEQSIVKGAAATERAIRKDFFRSLARELDGVWTGLGSVGMEHGTLYDRMRAGTAQHPPESSQNSSTGITDLTESGDISREPPPTGGYWGIGGGVIQATTSKKPAVNSIQAINLQIADVFSAKNGSFDTGFCSVGGHGALDDYNG